MRLLIASLVAVTAVAFAAPSFAQDATPPAATPAKHVHVKHKTTASASCSAMKSQSAKASCLKRLHAHAKPHKATKKVATVKKPAKSAQISPSTEAVPAASTPSQPIAVPPLPQKTI